MKLGVVPDARLCKCGVEIRITSNRNGAGAAAAVEGIKGGCAEYVYLCVG
jgi:hypothetical protein